jgi:hypothetical protein
MKALSLALAHALALASVVGACSSSSLPPAGAQGPDASSSSGGGSSGGGSSGGSLDSGGAGGDAEAGAADTWASFAQGFFTQYCVECHGVSDPQGLYFGVHANVVANASLIRCGVCVMQDPSWSCPATLPAKQFPISDNAGTNPKPSDAERNRIVAWIDAGSP